MNRSSGLKMLARSVGRKNPAAIARQALCNYVIRERVMLILKKDIQEEIRRMCSKSTSSSLMSHDRLSLQHFRWEQLFAELRSVAPTFLRLLTACANVKRRERAKKNGKRGKPTRPGKEVTVGICAAILLRNRSPKMSLVQRLVSLILHRGHASKMVYNNYIHSHAF